MADDSKVVELIQMADAALTKAAQLEEQMQKMQKQASELIPNVVKSLVAGQRIDAKNSDATARALADPIKALEILSKVARHRNADEVNTLGKPVGESKTASANGWSYDNQPGRRTKEESPAFKQFYNRILGNG